MDLNDDEIEQICEKFHEAYERAAAGAGWETQERSRVPWEGVPEANKETMRSTIRAVVPGVKDQARKEGMDDAFRITASAMREYGDGPVSLAESLRDYHQTRSEPREHLRGKHELCWMVDGQCVDPSHWSVATPESVHNDGGYAQGRLDEAEVAAQALVVALAAAAKVAEREADRVEDAHVLQYAAMEAALELTSMSGAARADYILRMIARLAYKNLDSVAPE